MRFAKKTILVAALALAAAAGSAQAQQKPDEVLKMRQGMMQAIKNQFGPVGAFASGKGDLPANAAARGDNLAALGKMAMIGWPANSEAGNSKPDAFTSADFAKGWEAMAAESAKLAEIAKAGNADAIKTQAGAVGKTCKGCHETFKKD